MNIWFTEVCGASRLIRVFFFLSFSFIMLSTGTAIETPMEVTVRLTVRKDRPYTKTPHFHTFRPNISNEEHYCTTGIESDIREATRSAVRNMIAFLEHEFQMDRVAAYMLCSVAGDLRMHEVVCTQFLSNYASETLSRIDTVFIYRLICPTMS